MVSKTISLGSSPRGYAKQLKNVWVTEWVYVSVLETGFCGFESHPAHQYAELAQMASATDL